MHVCIYSLLSTVSSFIAIKHWNNGMCKVLQCTSNMACVVCLLLPPPPLQALPYWGSPPERKVIRKYWNQKLLCKENAPFHILITSYQLVSYI